MSGMAGQSLTLECDANGFPAPEIVWLKDGQPVGVLWGGWAVGGIRIGTFWMGSRTGRVWRGDVTGVWGSAVGSGGSLGGCVVERAWHSFGSKKPQVPDPSHQLPLASSTQIPEAGGHRLLDKPRALHFPRIQEGDAGLYSCRAENQAGIAQRDFDLLVLSE